MPSLLTDGTLFFPNVLKTDGFKRKGFLYQQEPGVRFGLHWVVIDPRKHTLVVWRKDEPNFVTAAQGQANATVVTNGPFFEYQEESRAWGALCVTASAFWGMAKYSGAKLASIVTNVDPVDVYFDTLNSSIRNNFGARAPVGHLYAGFHGFSETSISAVNGHYFGRGNGRQFADYVIGQGESPQIAEVVGGFPRAVESYAVTTTDLVDLDYGFYGLAPLNPADAVWNVGTARSELEAALSELAELDSTQQPAPPALTGVVITVYQSSTPAAIAALMAQANVRDAVQLDGSTSVLLGVEGNIKVGSRMPPHKVEGNTWGYKFLRG